ncbi:N,N-dimethylformamidase beta subunit family domain-containing protein [Streptomyces sp. NPDC060184]|uniref:N,N-dimethylformamidase beta subunit family domain-containing protein n=1 Tax=Streptomyces sp. NPDC060184 TaxID=3347064 RepID=UPI003647BFE7
MAYVSRRSLLRFLGAATVAGGGVTAAASPACAAHPAPRTGDNPVVRENLATGSDAWAVGHRETSGVTCRAPEIQGYASATSVAPGSSLGFHLASHRDQTCTVSVYRVGHYAGAGARHLLTGEPIPVGPGDAPAVSRRTGAVACDWPVSWTLDVPSDWVSGIFLAVFTTEDGFRSFTPFVVREESRRSDVLVVLPFTGYQADNVWPLPPGPVPGDGPLQVSFDRPYAGLGLPAGLVQDAALARWVEEAGYDVTYASALDLHEGRVDPARCTAVVLSGREAHWSREMRDGLTAAVGAGTRLALLDADGAPGRVRLAPSADGRPSRVLTRRPVGLGAGTGIRLARRTAPGAGSWPWQGGIDGSRPAGTGHGVRVDEDGHGRLVLRAGAVSGGPAWALALGEPEHLDAAVGSATGKLFDRMVGERPRGSGATLPV